MMRSMGDHMKSQAPLLTLTVCLALSACGHEGRLFPDVRTSEVFGTQYAAPAPAPTVRQPILPEMLVPCRGHVLVPAIGMLLVPRGREAPVEGQFLKEENITAPYRILPPGARISQEMSPARLNVELDREGRITGLYCG